MLIEREMDTKVCGKCREVKTLDGFTKNKAKKDGHQTKCKACEKERHAEYRAAHPEKEKERHAKYYAANPEKRKESQSKWYAANPDYQAEWCAANPEKIKEYQAKWCAANPEKRKERDAEYRAANPHKSRANTSNYRAAKSKAIPKWLTKEDWQSMEAIGKEAKRIELETGIKMHVDHIHPLKGRLICGLQCPSNLQILTATQNCSKGNKFKPYVESES